MQGHRDPCPRCEAIVAAIASDTAENGWPPSYREIAVMTGFASQSAVVYHLDELDRAGRIERGPGARCVRLVALAEGRS
jgi:SOS-response transcriptional repressor LexA